LTTYRVNVLGSVFLLLAAGPLAAQDALDRTNPATQVSRDEFTNPSQAPIRIEFQPVLDASLEGGSTEVLDIGAILIDGLVAMDRADFAAAIEPFAGRPLDRAELVQLTDAIAARARAEGYLLATAWIP